jgi:hypothetical protein
MAMKCRKNDRMPAMFGASLLGLALAALAPLGYGGGGDEGVDILPSVRGGSSGPSFGLEPTLNRYLTIHGGGLASSRGDSPHGSGFVTSGHTNADVYLGLPGTEPGPAVTALDILTKGPRQLLYSDLPQSPGSSAPSFVHMVGRFQVEDVDPSDDLDDPELVTYGNSPGILATVVGQRSTHSGGIGASFATVDSVTYETVSSGRVDLNSRRAAVQQELAGTGCDVAFVLFASTPRGTDQVWAAFNVDDQRALYDLDIRVK